MPLLTEIPYHADSADLFEAIADRPWSVFLDSGRPACSGGRYDILSTDPMLTLVTRGGISEIRSRAGSTYSDADPFLLLRDCLHASEPGVPAVSMEPGPIARAAPASGSGAGGCVDASGPPGGATEGAAQAPRGARAACPELPFSGGAIGWFGYDLGRRIESLPALAVDAEQLPDMALGLYDWCVVVDHGQRRSWLAGRGRDPRTQRNWGHWLRLFAKPRRARRRARLVATEPIRSNLGRAQYGRAFQRIQAYIRAGDCYQVNLAQRFAAAAAGDAWSAYRALRYSNPAPLGAYLNTPHARVLSASPERFLALREGAVETRPIKGTRPRGGDPETDRGLAADLMSSAKDRAENVMIVDLLRNDLGRVCVPGSVRVPALFALESFATVHHLVSTVTGRLAPGQDAPALLRACFPGGSVTGAPKIRAMEIIEALEPHRRGIYCGAIGYLGFDGGMDTNIAIRTVVYSHGQARFWAGGGIVHDSTEAAEYQETLDKAAALRRLLEGLH